jgi:hypothetical protein
MHAFYFSYEEMSAISDQIGDGLHVGLKVQLRCEQRSTHDVFVI